MTVKCPRCKSNTELKYEGSHDWTVQCGICELILTVYIPHHESESEHARLAVERITIFVPSKQDSYFKKE